nr:MAG TPA: hypothetical protein [Caudoviricetes sp.]
MHHILPKVAVQGSALACVAALFLRLIHDLVFNNMLKKKDFFSF